MRPVWEVKVVTEAGEEKVGIFKNRVAAMVVMEGRAAEAALRGEAYTWRKEGEGWVTMGNGKEKQVAKEGQMEERQGSESSSQWKRGSGYNRFGAGIG